MKTAAIVNGSLAAIAAKSGASLAESFLSVDALILIDMSGSMSANDAPGGLSRYEAAERELVRLQESMPGKIGVIAFSDAAEFCPGGRPYRMGGSTDMVAALNMAYPADDTGIRLVLISDGEPNDGPGTLAAAARFKSHIDTVYIGPEYGGGRKFLERLARASGGQAMTGKAPGLLAEQVTRLLTA